MKKLLLFFLLSSCLLTAQSKNPKYEFRGVWVATVENQDWPRSRYDSPEKQKQDLIDYFNTLAQSGCNAVFFQIRTECDALYKSDIEPWSYWLTGEQGKAPAPFYDPLEFAVQEAHKRGMELHAWLNPYRAVKVKNTPTDEYPVSAQHPVSKHPEWILTVGNYKMLNPGLQEVIDYNVQIVMDVLNRYDVDGIHMDDYFYPYEVISNQDNATFTKYPRGFANIGDWRRDNVNRLIKTLNDTIMTVKPYIKFGVSPFGIWKPGIPEGIRKTAFDAFNTLYCDPMAWLQQASVDYITPQLYWPHGGDTDYGLLLRWWADSTFAHNRHLYIGHGVYNMGTWPAYELPKQVMANRSLSDKCQGSIYFQAKSFFANTKGFVDSLMNNYYANPALTPVMSWKNPAAAPAAPSDLRYELNKSTGRYEFTFTKPQDAARVVIYRSESASAETGRSENIFALTGENRLNNAYTHLRSTKGEYFYATSVNKYGVESKAGNVLHLNIAEMTPAVPVPVYPENGNQSQGNSARLVWKGDAYSSGYQLEVSLDPAFSSKMVVVKTELKDTVFTVTGVVNKTSYYWRVKSLGLGQSSSFSPVFTFMAGYPSTVTLVAPAKSTYGVSENPVFKWTRDPVADRYRLQLSLMTSFLPQYIVADTVVSDTTVQIFGLALSKNHYWRVKALNSLGESDWTASWGFKTTATSGVEEDIQAPRQTALEQNYPNPFNPSTRIKYQLSEGMNVSLKVYNLIGREVAVLVSGYQPAGYYNIEFQPGRLALASGVYFYRLEAGNFTASKKLIYLK